MTEESDCLGCHWHRPNDSYAKCLNLTMDGWEPNPEKRCGEYVRSEDYRPEGIWAGVAEAIKEVGKAIEEEDMKGGDTYERNMEER